MLNVDGPADNRPGEFSNAVLVNLVCGLLYTAAIGLWLVGALNLISVAFIPLFVGLGVDFGIQYSVRYRSERYKHDDLTGALVLAAKRSAVPRMASAMSLP